MTLRIYFGNELRHSFTVIHFGYAAVAREGHPDNVVGAYDAPAFLCPHGGGTATLVSFAFDNLVSLLALALGSGTFSDHLIKTSIYGTCSVLVVGTNVVVVCRQYFNPSYNILWLDKRGTERQTF